MFAYCNNNPVMNSDPNGTWIIKDGLQWVADKVAKPVVKWIRDTLSEQDGTITVGISAVGSPSFWSFNFQIGLSADFKGNISLQKTIVGGVSTGNPSLFGGFYGMITNAPSTEDLNGLGCQIGGSLNFQSPSGISAGLGGEYNIIDANDSHYRGVTGSLGIASNPGGEFHTEWGETTTIATINIYDILGNIYQSFFGK